MSLSFFPRPLERCHAGRPKHLHLFDTAFHKCLDTQKSKAEESGGGGVPPRRGRPL